MEGCRGSPCLVLTGSARGLPIGYARVPVADGSQLLDPRPAALIGTSISGRKAALGGCGASGSPDEAEIRPVQAARGWVPPNPSEAPESRCTGLLERRISGTAGS